MNFSSILYLLKEGRKVLRKGWNGKGLWLQMQRPDAHSKMTLPYIYIHTAQGDLVPWTASQGDLLSSDWDLYDAP
jgi:hypothetical protein